LRVTTRSDIVLGLRANWQQFALLVMVNAFVGGMFGLERSVLPLLARDEFGIASTTAAVSFIAAFGGAKALSNLFAGQLASRFTRKSVLVTGWLFGLPVPFLVILAPTWEWVVGANLLLGVNQGLAWSMTVNMKIDLVGPKQRGLALGLNEAAGYMAVAGAAYAAGVIAESFGLRPEPFYLGIAFAGAGLALSLLVVQDTRAFVALEATSHPESEHPRLTTSFAEVTWRQPRLWAFSQTGFVNNLNDALVWGVFPLYFASQGLSVERVAFLSAAYPLLWGSLQILTGWLSDRVPRETLIVGGMLVQGAALWTVAYVDVFNGWLAAVCLAGIGTAMVYPTLLAAIGDSVHPLHRSSALGVYRFWRDAGAIAGALISGVLADTVGFTGAIRFVAALTMASGLVAALVLFRSEKQVTVEVHR
jgi:MFS family permease